MITTIMPARNAGNSITESIESVLACSHVTELLIVDDGSTDDTLERIAAISDERIRVVEGPEQGISAALNCAFALCTTPYIARCDADDLFVNDRFEWQLPFLEKNNDHVAICSGFETIDKRSKVIAGMALSDQSRDITDLLRNGEATTHFGTWLFRRNAIDTIGGARAWFTSAEDLDIQFRLGFEGKVWQEQRTSYRYRLHDSSITHTMASIRREFFDRQSRVFAKQRRANNTDDLDSGYPPTVPTIDHSCKPRSSGRHKAGLLQGEAWRQKALGNKKAAIKCAIKAALLQPTHFTFWKSLALLVIR